MSHLGFGLSERFHPGFANTSGSHGRESGRNRIFVQGRSNHSNDFMKNSCLESIICPRSFIDILCLRRCMVSGFKLSTHPMHKKSAQSHYNELIDSTVRDARPIKGPSSERPPMWALRAREVCRTCPTTRMTGERSNGFPSPKIVQHTKMSAM